MLLLQSGNSFDQISFPYSIDEISQVGEARRFALVLCAELDFEEVQKGRVGIIVNELGNNLIRYAQKSQLIFRKFTSGDLVGIEILSIDSGPGMDEYIAIKDGYSTGTTPGTGLGSVKRQSDLFDIYSHREKGTVIVSRVFSKRALNYTNQSMMADDSIEVGAINCPYKGEQVSGDSWLVQQTEMGLAVIVADGLGHGPLANVASTKAIRTFKDDLQSPLDHQMNHISNDLKGTRGAAVFILLTAADSISYSGVGNISAFIQEPTKAKNLSSQNGTAGIRIGSVRVNSEEWGINNYLILHSDGLTNKWNLNSYPGIYGKHPSIIAAVLFRDCNRFTDDSAIVVIRRAQ